MNKSKKGAFYLIGWILLLIAVFVSFIVVLQFQKNAEAKIKTEDSHVVAASKNFNAIVESTKADTINGLKIFLIIGGILSIAGIFYLFFWVIRQYKSKTNNFEKDFRV